MMKIDKKKLKRLFLNIILMSIILTMLICIMIEKYEENNIKENNYESQKLSAKNQNNLEESTENETNIELVKEYPKEKVINTYKGYNVCAKLEIPAISLETYILSNYSKQALKISVTKLWGEGPNQKGNFCIAGHNFNNKNMFSNIKKLNLGDKLYVIDNEIGKVEYEVFEIYKVVPKDVTCLDSVTDNEKEVTLITCTSDSKKRIIVKAKESDS